MEGASGRARIINGMEIIKHVYVLYDEWGTYLVRVFLCLFLIHYHRSTNKRKHRDH